MNSVILSVAMDDEMLVAEQRFMPEGLAKFFDSLAEEQTEHQREHKAVKHSEKAGTSHRQVFP
jgi:hypothetical protein